MSSISLGSHFERFVEQQITGGRYQNVSEVVRAGLRLLEDSEISARERAAILKAQINQAWDDPRPGRSADAVFARLEKLHKKMRPAAKKNGA